MLVTNHLSGSAASIDPVHVSIRSIVWFCGGRAMRQPELPRVTWSMRFELVDAGWQAERLPQDEAT